MRRNKVTLLLMLCSLWITIEMAAHAGPIVDMNAEMSPIKINPDASDGRVTGSLMRNWQDDSSWASAWVDYQVASESGDKYLRVKVNELQKGICQFFRLVKLEKERTKYRLTFSAAMRGRAAVSVGIRQRSKPYGWLAQKQIMPESEWTQYRFDLDLQDQPGSPAIFFLIRGVAEFRLKNLTLEALGDGEGGPDKTVACHRNRFRNSTFPLGLPSGWNLHNCFSLGDMVRIYPAPDRNSPSGSAPLVIVCPQGTFTAYGEKNALSVYTAPFERPELNKPYTASVYMKGSGQGRFSVFCNAARIAEKNFSFNRDSQWTRIAVPFTPKQSGAYYCEFELSGTFYLDAIQVNSGAAATAYHPDLDCEVALTQKPGDASAAGIVFSDEPGQITYEVTGECSGATLHFRMVNLYGEQQEINLEVDRAGKSGVLNLAGFAAHPLGPIRVEAWVVDQAGKRISTWNELIVNRLRRPRHWGEDAPESPFGVHVLPTNQHIVMAKAIGVNWVRLHDAGVQLLGWAYLERNPGEWTFDDAGIQRYRNHKIKILGELTTAPAWESHASRSTSPPWPISHTVTTPYFLPLDIDKYAAYTRKIATRYRNEIDCYDVWNEPWLPKFMHIDFVRKFPGDAKRWSSFKDGWYIAPDDPAAEFMKLQQTAYRNVKAVNPAFKVLGFNTAVNVSNEGQIPGRQFTAEMQELGAMKYCDVICYHQYLHSVTGFPGDEVSRGFQWTFDALIKQYGGKFPHPVWLSEGSPIRDPSAGFYKYTFADSDKSTMREESDRVVRFVVSLLANRVKKVFLYSMGLVYHFGKGSPFRIFVTLNGELHPMGCAYSAMTWTLEDRKFVKEFEVGKKVYAYVFSGNGKSTAVLLADPRTLDFSYVLPDSGELTLTDLFGNPVKPGTAITQYATYATMSGSAEQLEQVLTRKINRQPQSL